MLRKLNTKHAGFTLVEIMIVVAIIALLAAIAVPNFLRSRKRSQATQILEDLRQLDSAIDQYAIEFNKSGPTAKFLFSDLTKYVKTGTRLYSALTADPTGVLANDLLGHNFGSGFFIDTVDSMGSPRLYVHPVTFTALSDVAPVAFWSPWVIAP